MADYLLPNNNLLNLDKQRIFGIRNKIIEISNNFPMGKKETKCTCGEKEEMPYIYYCGWPPAPPLLFKLPVNTVNHEQCKSHSGRRSRRKIYLNRST